MPVVGYKTANRIPPTKKRTPSAKQNRAKTNKAKVKPKPSKESVPLTCVCCGEPHKNATGYFTKSNSDVFKTTKGYCPICNKCLDKKYEFYIQQYDQAIATKIMCHYLDIPYLHDIYLRLADKQEEFTYKTYSGALTNLKNVDKTFANSLLRTDKDDLSLADKEYAKNRYWSPSDVRDRDSVLEIVGYDPFVGYSEEDRIFMFKNLIGYLDEDGIEDDQYKISQIIQLLNNNYQIRQIDTAIAKLDPRLHSDNIGDLTTMKQKLVVSNDKIAKENGISAKNRLNQNAGRSTLTYLMKDLREKNFTDAEANYYNQLTSEGTQWAANMSLKAILENGFFDENDRKDMLASQYTAIQDLQSDVDNLEENNRLLLIQNNELKKYIADKTNIVLPDDFGLDIDDVDGDGECDGS